MERDLFCAILFPIRRSEVGRGRFARAAFHGRRPCSLPPLEEGVDSSVVVAASLERPCMAKRIVTRRSRKRCSPSLPESYPRGSRRAPQLSKSVLPIAQNLSNRCSGRRGSAQIAHTRPIGKKPQMRPKFDQRRPTLARVCQSRPTSVDVGQIGPVWAKLGKKLAQMATRLPKLADVLATNWPNVWPMFAALGRCWPTCGPIKPAKFWTASANAAPGGIRHAARRATGGAAVLPTLPQNGKAATHRRRGENPGHVVSTWPVPPRRSTRGI